MDSRVILLVVLLPLILLFFVGLWLAVVAILGLASGWRGLQKRYPDREAPPLLILSMQSGTMGAGVNLRNILTLSACAPGLRVAIWPIFGPFLRPFLVPWTEIEARGGTELTIPVTRLTLGGAGRLTLEPKVWARLSAARSGGS